MKRRITALILIAVLIAASVQPASADSSGLCFTATNDYLLDLGSMAAFVSGTAYIPAKVFSTFGVYFNYFESESTAVLYNGNKEIFFNLVSGNSYDSANNTQSVSATFKYGQVYVPVAWVCSYFGLSYSYINGNGYGDVVRLKNSKAVLSDSQFLDAATSLMKTRYDEYFGNVTASPTPPATSPTGNETNAKSASLCFIGLPSENMLDILDNFSANVCFFITADEAKTSPDTVRRIYGSGHSLGIYCTANPETECEAASEIIFEAAQQRPVLITSPDGIAENCSAYAENNGYAYFKPELQVPQTAKNAGSVSSEFENLEGFTSISIFVNDDSEDFLHYILSRASAESVKLLPLIETYI